MITWAVVRVAVTVPAGRSLLGHVVAHLQSRAKAKNVPSRAAAAIRDHAGTFTALGFADTAAWHSGAVWGYLATAACILLAEFKVRG